MVDSGLHLVTGASYYIHFVNSRLLHSIKPSCFKNSSSLNRHQFYFHSVHSSSFMQRCLSLRQYVQQVHLLYCYCYPTRNLFVAGFGTAHRSEEMGDLRSALHPPFLCLGMDCLPFVYKRKELVRLSSPHAQHLGS